jgi:hypothetical protein
MNTRTRALIGPFYIDRLLTPLIIRVFLFVSLAITTQCIKGPNCVPSILTKGQALKDQS